jgi:hypothetical protein
VVNPKTGDLMPDPESPGRAVAGSAPRGTNPILSDPLSPAPLHAMVPPVKTWLPIAVGFALCGGCTAEIGDECSANVDCSTNGDRACDTSAPGGYCTILDCRANGCPEEAMCVAWGEGVAQRTFCMRHCGSDSDCRDGYQCFKWTTFLADNPTARPADYGVILDANPAAPSFCTRDW